MARILHGVCYIVWCYQVVMALQAYLLTTLGMTRLLPLATLPDFGQ